MPDTTTSTVARLADWAERDFSAMREHPHHPWPDDRTGGERIVADTLRALAAERDAAVARASEHSAYRTAASAFIASKGLSEAFDVWCERGGLEANAYGALVAVARAAFHERRSDYDGRSTPDSRMRHRQALDDALDALPPGILDQEPSESTDV